MSLILLMSGVSYGITPSITYLTGTASEVAQGKQPEVYFFHEFHCDYDDWSISSQQKDDFLAVVKELSKSKEGQGVFVVGESKFDYQGNDSTTKNYFDKEYQRKSKKKNSRSNNIVVNPYILSADITKACTEQGVPNFNVECRHSIGLSLHNIAFSGQQLYQEFQDHVADIRAQLQRVMAPIHGTSQAQLLNEYCEKVIQKVTVSSAPLINYIKDKQERLFELQQRADAPDLNKLVYYDSDLIDVKVILEILEHNQYENVFVYVGSKHAFNAIDFLQKNWGYVCGDQPAIDYANRSLKDIVDNCVDIKEYFDDMIQDTTKDASSTFGYGLLLLIMSIIVASLIFMHASLKKLFTVLIVLCVGNAIYAITPTINHVQNTVHKNLPENVFLMHEFHADYADCRISKKQSSDAIDAIKQLGGLVIGETSYDYQGDNPAAKKYLEELYVKNIRAIDKMSQSPDKDTIKLYPAILSADFTLACKQEGIPSINVEFRQGINGSLDDLSITGHDLYVEFYQNIKKIKDDLRQAIEGQENNPEAQALQVYCEQALNRTEHDIKPIMDVFNNNFDTLPVILKSFNHQMMQQLVLIELIDIKILLEIYKNRDQKNIFIFVGNTHAKHVMDFLLKSWNYTHKVYGQEKDYSGNTPQIIISNHIDVQEYFENIVQDTQANTRAQDILSYGILIVIISLIFALYNMLKASFKNLFAALVLFCVGNAIYAITPSITHLQNNEPVMMPENIYIMHEFHCDYEDCTISRKQQDDTIDAIKKLGGMVIGETSFDYQGDNPEVKKFLEEEYALYLQDIQQANRPSKPKRVIMNPAILSSDFTLTCKKENIPHVNVEFRQTLNGSVNNLAVTAHDLWQEFHLNIEKFKADLARAVNGNEDTSHAQALQAHCAKALIRIEQSAKPFMQLFHNNHQTLHTLMQDADQHAIDQLYLYDAELIDIKILLELYKNRNEKNVFIFVGDFHAANVMKFLLGPWNYTKKLYGQEQDFSNAAALDIIKNHIDIEEYFQPIVQEQKLHAQGVDLSLIGLAAILILLIGFSMIKLLMRSVISRCAQ